ncbi:MAG: alpha amylase, catalytic subdomain, partial [Proteobacteria bacterium]|nr:alpha amylase, catalytic subdomain [Pseudomonadota bacterium]
MTAMTALDRLCSLVGIEVERTASDGSTSRVSDDTKRAMLAAMGISVGDDTDASRVCEELEDSRWLRFLEPVSVQSAAEPSCSVEIVVPRQHEHGFMAWLLEMESGERREGRFCPAELPVTAERLIGERRYRRWVFTLPEVPPAGYHRLSIGSAESGWCAAVHLIMTPARAYLPPILQSNGRVWGVELPLFSLRSRRNWGMGDFTDLLTVVDFAAEKGADVVAVDPLHAMWPHDPARRDPYEPSSRLMYNLLYLDIEAIADFRECEAVQSMVSDPAFQARLRLLRGEERVNYEEVAAAKRGLLERLFAHFRSLHQDHGTPRGKAFSAFKARLGESLRRRLLFDALSEHFARQDLNVWSVWPGEFRSLESTAVRTFAETHGERLDFFAYLYWQADLQLEAVGRRSFEWGLGVGLCQAVSLTPSADGGEVWAESSLYARSFRLGAPPDPRHPEGEAGGVSPFIPQRLREAAYAPLVEALRENMRHTGAVILRPASGLLRQYWVPEGASPREGAYVSLPTDDLLGIIALESQRSRCMVLAAGDVAVPDASGEPLTSRAIFGCRSLFGELAGSKLSPESIPGRSALSTAMPDDPTLRGFWLGWDLDERSALDLFASEDRRAEQIATRGLECAKLLAELDRENLLPEGVSVHPTSVPDMTLELVRAVYRRLGGSRAQMVLLRVDDMLGQIEQTCLRGAPEAYPNWRRKLPLDLEEWGKEAKIDVLVGALNEVRGASLRSHPRRNRIESKVRFSIPQSTYRLQFNRDFTFRQASELLPYLQELGISHCYASPYLKARPGSRHGYDIIDHGEINPEIGSREEFEHFVSELERLGMGQILDMVPNHMGVMGSDNAWWLDVLENGQASDYAGFFDIEWSPVKDNLRGKVLLPILGAPYGAVLESGEITLAFDAESGSFSAHYGPHLFPIDPREYPLILRHRLDQLGAAMGEEHSQLLELQTLI